MTATDHTSHLSISSIAAPRPRWQPALAAFAVALAVLTVPAIALALIDDRTVLGVNTWIKPIKFLLSTAVYVFTLSWAIQYVHPDDHQRRPVRFVVVATVAASVVEMVIIVVRAALAQQSHFNTGTFLDAAWYYVMAVGAVILVSTSAVLGRVLWHRGLLTGARRLAWSSGLFMAGVLGGVTGMAMGSRESHAVGTATEMRSMPFVGWSTTIGDLRIAHFLALHSMFVLPLAGAIAVRLLPERNALRVVRVGVVVWAAVVIGALINAFLGRPL